MRISHVLQALDVSLNSGVGRVQFAVDDPDLPLKRLARAYQLSPFEVDLLLAALLPSLDDRIAAALLLKHGQRFPPTGDVIRSLGAAHELSHFRDHLSRSAIWREHLLVPSDLPILQRPLLPIPALLDGIEGRLPELPGARRSAGEPSGRPGLTVHPSRPTSHAVRQLWLAPRQTLHLQFTRPPTVGEFRSAELWAVLQGAALVVELLGPELVELPPALGSRCEVHLAVRPDAQLLGAPSYAVWRQTKRLQAHEQREIWREHAPNLSASLLGRLANFTFLHQDTVRRIAQRALSDARDPEVAFPEAIRVLSPPPSARYAVTTSPRVPWEQLILPDRPTKQLQALINRVEHRAVVQGDWSMCSPDGRGDGIVGVFHGESGTGKTFAVEAIASRLGMPVLRVDLSRVVSKYIGETEKHLAELFDRAEGFRALLFFDEADALFGKRTNVKDAHDRYANIETNFLLQRLELFDGLALLATNLMQNLDDAFLRRLHYVVYFPTPDAPARLRLWQQLLPSGKVGADVDLHDIARSLDMVGGDIRNAAIEAAYRAANHDGTITGQLLYEAIAEELTKRGKAPPPRVQRWTSVPVQ